MANWMRGLAMTGLGLALWAGVAAAQNEAPRGAAGAQPAGRPDSMGDRDIPGPIDSLQDLQDTGKMLFKLTDTNNDNLISEREAIDAGNLLVGGFFFRADQNGDGKVSQEEARTARENLLRQKPFLRLVLDRARNARQGQGGNQPGGNAAGGNQPGGNQPGGTNPAQALAGLLDTNNDRQLEATELRQAVQTAVQGLYQTADTNRDRQLSPTEINAAMIGAARGAAQAAFQQADADHNGALSEEEFLRSIQQPARAIFRMVDANNDGQLSQQEMQSAQRLVMSQLRMLRVTEPGNSAGNMIRSGQTPDQAAPVPSFGAPNQPAPGATAPAQPQPR